MSAPDPTAGERDPRCIHYRPCKCGSPATPDAYDASEPLTEAERETWDVDPAEWPHTPPLHIFRALYEEDDNLWWRAGSGHGQNAYDAALEEIDRLAAREAAAATKARADERGRLADDFLTDWGQEVGRDNAAGIEAWIRGDA